MGFTGNNLNEILNLSKDILRHQVGATQSKEETEPLIPPGSVLIGANFL